MSILGIIGAGELGQQIAHLAKEGSEFEEIIFFDDYAKQDSVNGYRIIGGTNSVSEAFQKGYFNKLSIGIGYKHRAARREFFEKFKGTIPFGNVIHSSVYLDRTTRVGEGLVVFPGCILDKGVILENNILLNNGVVVSHDSHIQSHCFISPRVAIAGFVKVGESCMLGINTTIIDNIIINDNIDTGGGTVVIKDLCNDGLYVGNPARFVK